MNRAEIRRQQKLEGKKDRIYHLTQGQIDKMKEEAVQEAVDVSFALMLSVPTNVLARCYWEKTAPKRIPQFLEECLSLYESIGTGTVQISELIKDVEELGKLKMDCIERLKKLRK
jgi:hypothetical protein